LRRYCRVVEKWILIFFHFFFLHRDETGVHVNSIPLSLFCSEFCWRSGERFPVDRVKEAILLTLSRP
jgi:hypothetical protein